MPLSTTDELMRRPVPIVMMGSVRHDFGKARIRKDLDNYFSLIKYRPNILNFIMSKKSKEKSAWTGVESIGELLVNFDAGLEYKYQFTSVDRLIELQEMFFLIKKYLRNCKIDNEEKLAQLKEELEIFRGFLSGIQREWEDCISEIDLISKNIRLKVMESPVLPVQIDSFENKVNNGSKCYPSVLSEQESKEFSDLLFYISKSRNVKIEDTRSKPGGGLFLSLLSKPGHVETIKLKRLVELGLEIWPGRNFLN